MPRLEERDYTYFTTVRGMCRRCRRIVPARVFFRDGQVWQESLCPTCHGEPALIAGDQQWYLTNVVRAMPDRAPLEGARAGRLGCPHDCGPCAWHASPCQLPVLSITNACNLRCPICFTYNRAEPVFHMPADELQGILDWIVQSSGPVDLINVTGGEPTLHPQLLDLLRLCRRPGIGRVTMNSNGLRLADDAALCRELAELGIYVVLSLSTFDPQSSFRLHGRDLVDVKLRAIENLTRAGAKMTLLQVMVRDENEDAVAGLLDLLQSNDNILSLTVQTMTYTGQGGGKFPRQRHIPVDEAARIVSAQSGGRIRFDDFTSRPSAHPLCYLISYLIKSRGQLHPLARLAPREQVEKLLEGSYLIRPGPGERFFREAIDRLYAEGRDDDLAVLRDLVEQLYPTGTPLDDFHRQQLAESAVRTVYLHAHMDEDTLDCSRAMLCPDLVPAEPGRMIPACTYGLFYRTQDPRFYEQEQGDPGPRPGLTSGDDWGIAPRCPGNSPGMDATPGADGLSRSAGKTLGITESVCARCRRMVPAKIIVDGRDVFFQKLCPEHGESRAPVRRDPEDYLQTLRYVKPAWVPREHRGRSDVPCPDGCGLCDRHEQHLCMPIVEITSRCDLSCPVCLVDAGRPWDMSLDEFRRVLDALVRAEGQIDVLNLSGGEPLVHPELLAFLDEALARPEIVRVSISTNGLRLLERPDLLEAIRWRHVVVSLQFDGFDDRVYELLRGRRLAAEKRAILERLGEADLSTSLTVTAAGGVNEDQLPAILDYFFAEQHVVSMTVQPTAFVGRGRGLVGQATRLTIPDVVGLLSQAGRPHVAASDFTPLPCAHPLCLKLAYYLVLDGGQTVSVGRLVEVPRLLDSLANRTIFGLDPQEHQSLKDLVYDLWSASAGSVPEGEAVMKTLRSILDSLSAGCGCFDPRRAFLVTERRIKSIFIHAFQDPDTFDLARVRRCCHAYPQADGTLIPACVHNVLRRSGPSEGSEGVP